MAKITLGIREALPRAVICAMVKGFSIEMREIFYSGMILPWSKSTMANSFETQSNLLLLATLTRFPSL